MAASYGVAINLPLPTAGQVQWDGPLNALLQALIDVLAQRVTVDGLDVEKSLEMNGNALIDASAVEFIAGGDPGTANSLFYANGELFCRDGSNRTVQLTNGGVVNVGGSGGFGGDYIATNQNGATYTNSTQTFTFTAAGGTSFAAVEGAALVTHHLSDSNRVTISPPASITGSYSITLPPGPPVTAGTGSVPILMDNAGNLTAPTAVTRLEAFALSGGTPFYSATPNATTLTTQGLQSNGWNFFTQNSTATGTVEFGIPHIAGDRINSITFGVGVGSAAITASVNYRLDAGTFNNIALVAIPATGSGLITLQSGFPGMTGPGFPFVTATSASYSIRFNTGGTAAGIVSALKVSRTRGTST